MSYYQAPIGYPLALINTLFRTGLKGRIVNAILNSEPPQVTSYSLPGVTPRDYLSIVSRSLDPSSAVLENGRPDALMSAALESTTL